MVKELLKKAIEQNNPFMTKDMIKLQIEFFSSVTPPKLTEEDKQELLSLLEPVIEEIVEETPVE